MAKKIKTSKPYLGGMYSAVTKRCYETHPPLKIGEFEVYGGSCAHPIVGDADVYIGFDHSMNFTGRHYPWLTGKTDEFLYPITDMSAPKDPKDFRKMLEWVCLQLEWGQKVHMGCIGGHGRTGMALAALYNLLTDEDDAITYVRENYCEKAVESKSQVEFLHKHFGITKVAPTKSYAPALSSKMYAPGYKGTDDYPGLISNKVYTITPIESPNIWGTHLDADLEGF